MRTKRDVLGQLTASELRMYVEYYNVRVGDRRVKSQMVDALATARKCQVAEALRFLEPDRLRSLCDAFGIDHGGANDCDHLAMLIGRGT